MPNNNGFQSSSPFINEQKPNSCQMLFGHSESIFKIVQCFRHFWHQQVQFSLIILFCLSIKMIALMLIEQCFCINSKSFSFSHGNSASVSHWNCFICELFVMFFITFVIHWNITTPFVVVAFVQSYWTSPFTKCSPFAFQTLKGGKTHGFLCWACVILLEHKCHFETQSMFDVSQHQTLWITKCSCKF